MKDLFPAFYEDERLEHDLARLFKSGRFKNTHELARVFAPKPDLLKHWSDTTFVFDANALNHMFLMSEALLSRYFEILQKVSDRIFIPYHAAREYHWNIGSSLEDAMEPLDDLIEFKQQIYDLIETRARRKYENQHWHWFFDDSTHDRMKEVLSELIEKADVEKVHRLESYRSLKIRIANLFNGKVGVKPSDEAVKAYDVEGERRQKIGMAPSCEIDIKKSDNKFGDVHVWLQLVDFASHQEKKHVLFITDDEAKGNWTIRASVDAESTPRPELCLELKRIAKCTLWILSTAAFIELGQKALELQRSEAVDMELVKAKKEEFLRVKADQKRKRIDYLSRNLPWRAADFGADPNIQAVLDAERKADDERRELLRQLSGTDATAIRVLEQIRQQDKHQALLAGNLFAANDSTLRMLEQLRQESDSVRNIAAHLADPSWSSSREHLNESNQTAPSPETGGEDL